MKARSSPWTLFWTCLISFGLVMGTGNASSAHQPQTVAVVQSDVELAAQNQTNQAGQTKHQIGPIGCNSRYAWAVKYIDSGASNQPYAAYAKAYRTSSPVITRIEVSYYTMTGTVAKAIFVMDSPTHEAWKYGPVGTPPWRSFPTRYYVDLYSGSTRVGICDRVEIGLYV